MTFIFYDTETTGVSTEFDQILRFAAIKTDEHLQEVDRWEVHCRLSPHIVPSPGALIVNGLTPAMLIDPSLPSHYDALRQIREVLTEWSPAQFLGFNSIRFDEELLRQAFFQTLHPNYLTNTSGNSRGDVMRIAQFASVYAPSSITIPVDERGRQTFSLGRLADANGVAHVAAHDAMADAGATLSIARILKENAADVWQAMARSARKSNVIDFLTSEQSFWLTEFYFSRPYSWLVTCCGQSQEIDSQLAVFDLAFAPDDYVELSVDELVGVLNQSQKVIRVVRANRQPMLKPAAEAPTNSPENSLPPNELLRRIELIRDREDFHQRVSEALARRFPEDEPSHFVEQRIYDGFAGRADEQLMDEFHRLEWEDRLGLCDRFDDPRLKEISRRLVYIERPKCLTQDELSDMDSWMKERLLSDDEVPWTTIPKAKSALEDLRKNASGSDVSFLEDIDRFLNELAGRFPSS